MSDVFRENADTIAVLYAFFASASTLILVLYIVSRYSRVVKFCSGACI